MMWLNSKFQISNTKQITISNTQITKGLVIRNWLLVIVWLLVLGAWNLSGFCQEEMPDSSELISKAWKAHGDRDIEGTFKYTQQCIDLYKEEADMQQASLKAMPEDKTAIEKVRILNDVAVAYFIQAESYKRQGKLEEAERICRLIIDKYPYAQGWDQRGWYWPVADIAAKTIKRIHREPIDEEAKPKVSQISTRIVLYDPGKEDFVDYTKYGEFQNIGTEDYRYVVKDQEGLILAVGEGVFPNTTSVRWDPAFKKAQRENRLTSSHWDFVNSPDLQAAFFKWALSPEPKGVKLFYTGMILEKSGLVKQAIKCYYSIVVHFPGSYGWTYWKTPWYIGQAAISKINFLLRRNPQLGYRLEGADISIINGYDNDVSNDIVITNPGKFVKVSFWQRLKEKFTFKQEKPKIKRKLGEGQVHLVQYETGDWQLMVEGEPYVIKGITYAPTKVGQSPDEGTLGNWMEEDFNNNGKADGPYDAFVDRNKNNLQDADEPGFGDFRLMKEMGVNTIRLYHHPPKVNKEILRDLYNNYGIRVIMGDFLGKYTIGSGAAWNPGTDYTNDEHRKNMLESVRNMVLEFKDEPFILFWLLGNENVYGYACNADQDPVAFYKFANEAAKMIKSLDPEHPVAICNGDILYLDKFGQYAPDIDIFGANAYRGNYGFGFFWRKVRSETQRPAFITEFGCPAYFEGRSLQEGEIAQADYHLGSWEDIENNMAFRGQAGNALGAVIFEWLDEWWKGYEPYIHDKKGTWIGPFPDGMMHEEWLGISGQGNGKLSPFLRQLRQSYYLYKELWE